jgi:hypothetical protein
MLIKNQFKLEPGPYEHYKQNTDGSHPIYVVESMVTHMELNGVWTKLQDPLVVYRNLEPQWHETPTGGKTQLLKHFARPFSEFTSMVNIGTPEEPKMVKRFKPV